MRRQTYGNLPSRKASPPIGRYQIILLGDRGTCVLTTCPGLQSTVGWLGFKPATYWSQVHRPTTTPPSHTTLQLHHCTWMQISKPARKAVCCRCKSTTPGIFHQVKKQQHARCRCEQTEPETYHTVMHNFLQVPFSALTLGRVTGWASGLQKRLGVGLLVVTIWLELIAPVVTTTSIILLQ